MCIVATVRRGGEYFERLATRMASVCQCIEHIFSLYYILFKLFRQPEHFRLLVSGVESYKLFFNSFLLWNCYQSIYQSFDYFLLAPPSLEEYLSLDATFQSPPNVIEEHLGVFYQYHI